MKLKYIFLTLYFLVFINCNKYHSSENRIVGKTYYLVQNESLLLCTVDITMSKEIDESQILTFSKCLLNKEFDFIGSYDKTTNSIHYHSLSRNMKIIFSEDGNLGFNGKSYKLGLLSKNFYENLSPKERVVILKKNLIQ